MNIREKTEQVEQLTLSPYAVLSANTKGREYPLEPCQIRTEFQRDRDRIIHSKSFRRLKHKTQVFITPEGDHYRTRLTHTLEVTQIARTIARALSLNEDLTEAMALGHDLGHTPFGHSGERALDQLCPFGFRHYEQSIRVVEKLEGGKGMNLTWEVRDGIANHTGDHEASTLEGRILKYADRIAYVNHDIDDAIRGGILRPEDLPKEAVDVLGQDHSQRINTMITSIIQESNAKPYVKMGEHEEAAMMKLRSFMYAHVYTNSAAKSEENKAVGILQSLYTYYCKHPERMGVYDSSEPLERSVCDYIAGMTDQYAVYQYQELFIPKGWQVK